MTERGMRQLFGSQEDADVMVSHDCDLSRSACQGPEVMVVMNQNIQPTTRLQHLNAL